MKKILAYFTILLVACNSPKGDSAEVAEKQTAAAGTGDVYSLDTTSVIHWAASKPTETHRGKFKLKEGSFNIRENKITGGRFLIDIASITNDDLTPEKGRDKLINHLKSPDFFEVAK